MKEGLQKRLLQGWNTWETHSVISHVLMPQQVGITLNLHHTAAGRLMKQWERQMNFWQFGDEDHASLTAGLKAYDGSYTEVLLKWLDHDVVIETAHEGEDLVMLVTAKRRPALGSRLVVEGGVFWNGEASVVRDEQRLVLKTQTREIPVYATGESIDAVFGNITTPYLAIPLEPENAVSTGRERTVDQVKQIVNRARAAHEAKLAENDELTEVYTSFQTCLAWDTIYDPDRRAAVSPVSRNWNCGAGPVMFEWDTYFACSMLAMERYDLAASNFMEITSTVDACGFVANFCTSGNSFSYDRSQPPVGALTLRQIWERTDRAEALAAETFDRLLTWNRWWTKARDHEGLLCWGSTPFEASGRNVPGDEVNDRFGGALESGLDNSPMYDDIPFDKERHILKLADVGLMGLFVRDCQDLAWVAERLGRDVEATKLRERGERYAGELKTLWDEKTGLFLNKRTDTGDFEYRLAPTHFYPLIAGVATDEQAVRMVKEHLLNEDEFWGEWVLPSIARNDPAFGEQNYWRGRIWGPMNYLVYLGLKRYDHIPEVREARKKLVEKSRHLLMKEWSSHRHVHENYCAVDGQGCVDLEKYPQSYGSDPFYHWGGLLGFVSFLEQDCLMRSNQ